MRFNSPQEMKAAAEKSAADIVRSHLEEGNDLNPYATPGGRAEYDRAYTNQPRRSWDTAPEWDYRYQLGQAAARIMLEKTQSQWDQIQEQNQ